MKKKIFYMLLGGILFTTVSVLAYNVSSNDVSYKKQNNEDESVKAALDDLYYKFTATSEYTEEQYQAAQSSCPSGMICSEYGTPKYRAWNATPTSSTSSGDHNVYVAKWSDGQLGVCINRNGTEYCFRYNNWFAEREHLQQVFSGENNICNVTSSYVTCAGSGFNCSVVSNGGVDCSGDSGYCLVRGAGSVECG